MKPPSWGSTAYDVPLTLGNLATCPSPATSAFLGSTVYQTTIASIDMICGRTLLTPPPSPESGAKKKQHIWQREGGRLVVWECFPSHVCSASQNVFPGNANQSVSAMSTVADVALTLHKPRTCLLKKILGASNVFNIIRPKVIVGGRCETCHSFL